MGTCCSKKSSPDPGPDDERNTISMGKPQMPSSKLGRQSTMNTLHNTPEESAVPLIVCDHPACKEFKRSLFTSPPAEELLVKFWIHKRGHLVRSWKKRYCVLEKNDLKYYKDSANEPPYGKSLKGHIALLGAVCIADESEDFSTINVEIFGAMGQKDLLFAVENSEEGKEFVNTLQWAIRKATMTVLLRNAKTTATWKLTKGEHYVAGADWTRHQVVLYEESIKGLKFPQTFLFTMVHADGSIVIRPGVLKMWTAFGDEFMPSVTTEGESMGISIHIWQPTETTLDPQSTFEDATIIPFADMSDVCYQYIDMPTTQWLKPQIQRFLHPKCSAGRYLCFTIVTEFGLRFNIISCCLHGYDDAFLNIQNIFLFIQSRKKLKEAAFSQDKENSKAQQVHSKLAVATALSSLQE